MTRLQADLCLGLTAIIWGSAFIAQKTVLGHLGPFTFAALRFALSALCVLPLALRERRYVSLKLPLLGWQISALCCAMVGGVLLQQYALVTASVTNGGMLTGLYVVLVPVVLTLVFRRRQSPMIWAAALLSIFGTWLLTSTTSSTKFALPQQGDLLLIASALSFAFQVVLTGMIVEVAGRPLRLCLLQYSAVAIVAGLLAAGFEPLPLQALLEAIVPAAPALLYAGIVSGGLAYTLQAVAQQHTPSSDAAIIMSAEGMIAALCGILLLEEPFTIRILAGCGTIMLAILLVEAGPGLRRVILRRTVN